MSLPQEFDVQEPGYCVPFIDVDGNRTYMKFTRTHIGLVDALGPGDKVGFGEPVDLRAVVGRGHKARGRQRKTVG